MAQEKEKSNYLVVRAAAKCNNLPQEETGGSEVLAGGHGDHGTGNGWV